MTPLPWHRATLAQLLADRERLPHAVLVQGREGIGKLDFARALAAGALCEAPRGGLACGECPSCHWFSQGNHPDFREIVPEAAQEEEEGAEAESPKSEKAKSVFVKIEQIRDVADFISLTTHRAGYRVLLIHPAEAMLPAAANALLKTLEEPPPHTMIVLVSGQPARLLPTIRSRCRAITLVPPPRPEALAWLREQGIEGAESALSTAGGAPLLARDLAEPGEAALRKKILDELARGVGDVPAFAATLEKGALGRFLFWMQTWIHDLIRMRVAGSPRHHVEYAKALQSRARAADLDALLALDRELLEARRLASHPLNPRLVAEHLLMAYNRAIMQAAP
ncbi:MAG TPA: DNA polymerase III subunit delta' [Usitatibacter sp.]|nr:DNA polymerase III subunit delta' [Usitatibacter sp.]